MEGYSIGLSGLDAAQRALDIIGNNIANAATEGYHRQRIELTPAYSSQQGSVLIGGGVDIANVTRIIDSLLEQEILRQQSTLSQVSRETMTLSTIETAFGELSSGSGLSVAIDEFFNALQDLAAHPAEGIWQNQVVSAAETLTNQFRTLSELITTMETQIGLEADNAIEQINTVLNQIAALNNNIERIEVVGGVANNLRDRRDQLINELSELINVETQEGEYGVVDVSLAGLPGVVGARATELEVGLREQDTLGISIAGARNYDNDVQGGLLGGLLALKNSILSEIHNDLDSLANAIIQQVNQYHVQGVGSAGSFTQLSGWRMESEDLADFDTSVTDGTIYIRVTDTSTGQITRHEIDVDVSTDSLTTIAAEISARDGLNATVSALRMSIWADAGYQFDFLPCVLPEPTWSNFTDPSPPDVSVSGIYTGTENQTFTFTVIGNGTVGVDDLRLEVTNENDEVIANLNIGAGYAAGDKLDVGNGIKIALGVGDLSADDDDSFEVAAFANSDTSGVLAAVGINTFFSGSSAANMAVCSDISANPGRIATSLGPDMTDNNNALRLAELKDEAVSGLGEMTPGQFYRRLVTDIGQQLYIKQIQQNNIEEIVHNLSSQQSEISGVDINDEAAQILIFEQMFQAMAKYLNTIQSMILTIMEVV